MRRSNFVPPPPPPPIASGDTVSVSSLTYTALPA